MAKDLLVENPRSPSPGLAFLLATVARFGEDRRRLKSLRANGVKVVDGWTQAYGDEFSAGGQGSRPLCGVVRVEPAGRGRVRRRPVDAERR